jgi:lipopolysaccharide transport system ATP-binding protein
MNDTIIRVENLGKRYSIRHQRDQRYTALRDVIAEKAKNLFRLNGRKKPTSDLGPLTSGRASKEDFWALKNISFEVRRGEVVGIIGRNGAGKSTLLKILSRITDPTEGRVKLKGRVASLLEVGTGFHPELTGRENIYLNGAILGMSRGEIKAKFDEIVAFAEVEKFLDTPVKRYSSGMYVRLAFAVAAHLEPEILVVDEVLAVGDVEFQKKCLGKMEAVSRTEGRTVLFVSHNLGAVRSLCQRGLVLNEGELIYNGSTERALNCYSQLTETRSALQQAKPDQPSITGVAVDEEEACSGRFKLEVQFSSPWTLDPVLIGAVIYNQVGAPVFGINTWQTRTSEQAKRGLAVLRVPNLALHSGIYRVAVFLGEKMQNYDVLENAATFTFVSPESLPPGLSAESIGPMRVDGTWQIEANE